MRIISKSLHKITNYFNYVERYLVFIWGASSCEGKADLYQANDIDIIYDKKIKKYTLGIETAFLFETKAQECKYLLSLLQSFHEYMVSENLSVVWEYPFFCSSLTTSCKADSIEELYFNFSIWVNGYCALYKEI